MLLELRQVVTGYGNKQVLFDFSMDVEPREIVAIIGPNGAGKSTVLKAVCGLLPIWEGHICFNGRQIGNSSPRASVMRGITYCPQGNRVFSAMTGQGKPPDGRFSAAEGRMEAASRCGA